MTKPLDETKKRGPKSRDVPDYLTDDGAHVLAAMIRGYWAHRGYRQVNVAVVRAAYADTGRAGPSFVVRSDLCNGWPRRDTTPHP